jgi:hypothetical protein
VCVRRNAIINSLFSFFLLFSTLAKSTGVSQLEQRKLPK